MTERILFVDDEIKLLQGFQRQLGRRFLIDIAEGASQGLAMIENQGPYAVVVSDLRMPAIDGVQFLGYVRERSPESVRIILTGYADLQTAIAAVNEGQVFRFLTKPCQSETLVEALEAALRQHAVRRAERDFLDRIFSGNLGVVTDALAHAPSATAQRAMRLHRLVHELLELAGDQPGAQAIELAALLSQLGCLSIKPEALGRLERGETLSPTDWRIFEEHPRLGRDLIINLPHLAEVAEIFAYQCKNYDGSGFPGDGRRGDQIPAGARFLHAALDYDALLESGREPHAAVDEMRRHAGTRYDPAVVALLGRYTRGQADFEERKVSLWELKPDMILDQDVRALNGNCLVGKGREVTTALKSYLIHYDRSMKIWEPIRVLVPTRRNPSPARRTRGANGSPLAERGEG